MAQNFRKNTDDNRIRNNNKICWICVIKGKGIMCETKHHFVNVTLANNSILLNYRFLFRNVHNLSKSN